MRLLKIVMVTIFLFAGIAATASGVRAQENATPLPADAEEFDIAAASASGTLHAACVGSGSPTVVFEPGGPLPSGGTSTLSSLGAFVAESAEVRFCTYDRAGTGQSVSPDGDELLTLEDLADDLQSVLAAPETGCPCIVAGHSIGGSIALVALAKDPSQFAGFVTLDSSYPGAWEEFLSLVPAGAPESEVQGAMASGQLGEPVDWDAGFNQIVVPSEAPDIPVVVVTHGAGFPPPCWPCSEEFPADELETLWQAGQQDLADTLAGELIVAEDTDHFITDNNPDLVAEIIASVATEVRAGQ